MNKKTILTLSFISLFALNLFATDVSLPFGYLNIQLGMSVDETKEELLKNRDFGYKGDRDVSLVPGTNQILIETDASSGYGSVYLSQCWFQFYNDKLFTITINLNQKKMDYYSMFTTLTKKYGEPDTFSPEKAVWKNDDIIMSLEKPLTIKYIDVETYEEIQTYANVQLSAEEVSRNMFLDEF